MEGVTTANLIHIKFCSASKDWHEICVPPARHGSEFQKGTERPCDGTQVSDKCRATKLEQGLHQDQGAEEGQGDGVLLRESHARSCLEAKMQRFWIHIQERSVLIFELFSIKDFFHNK